MKVCMFTCAFMVKITILFFCGDWHTYIQFFPTLSFGVFFCLFPAPLRDSRSVAEEVT